MTSTYSDLGLELMVTGENAGTWGDKTNINLNLINQVAAGYESIALSDGGTVTLALTDGAVSNARNMILKFTGTLTSASTVTIPDALEKFYIIDLSAVVGVTNLTIKTVSGTGFTAGEAAIVAAYSDGTNLNEIALNTLGGTIATAQIADNAITTAKISDNQITTAKISDNQITTAKVSDLQITTAKIADDAITPDKLSNTAVTAGAYTTADITVDAQGRITAAADGAGGSFATEIGMYATGPASGTYTASPEATKLVIFAGAAGGGGGGAGGYSGNRAYAGNPGGSGGYGVFLGTTVTAPFAQPYAIGGGGNGGNGYPGTAGNAGGATSITNIFSFTGGNGGNTGPNNGPGMTPPAPGGPGNAGAAPGADSTAQLWTNSLGGGGGGGGNPMSGGNPGGTGGAGSMIIMES